MDSQQGPIFKYEWTLIPAWISNYIYYELWVVELFIYFQTSTVQPLEFENG